MEVNCTGVERRNLQIILYQMEFFTSLTKSQQPERAFKNIFQELGINSKL